MILELEAFAALIGEIYDAALDPNVWPAVLESATRFIGGVAAVMYLHDVDRNGRFFFRWGDDEEYTRLYFEKYAKINPILPHLMMMQPGEVFAASQLMPYEELRASRFFKEWLAPQGYTDLVATTLDRTTTSVATISVGRDVSQGLMDDEAIRRMKLLAPHFRRSVLIGQVLGLHKLEAATLADSLDGLAAGVFLVDEQGAIVFTNASGTAMLAEANVVRRTEGLLAPTDADGALALAGVLAVAGAGDAPVSTRGISVPLAARDGEQFVAHVLGLTSGARRAAGLVYQAVAAVFIRKAALDLPSPIETMAKRYKLTPTELRVLSAVVEVGGVPAVAAVLGISEATVKTHLQHLFEKTGTNRQIDLVKVLAGFANPLAG